VQKEGLLAFYKGTLAPLFGVGACVSVQFYAFHEAKRQLQSSSVYTHGAIAGMVNTPITSPVEQLRILLQTQPSGANKIYHGPRDALRKIWRQHGLKAVFRGFNITLLREAQAYGVWFYAYESLIAYAIKSQGVERHEISTPQLLLFGALSGQALWLASYPLDVIKTRVQSDLDFSKRVSSLNVAKRLLREQGIGGFWKGIGPALVRAVPCSAGTFATVELTLRLLG
jgi:solute carrier family 25 carnitine/acylcarnitine transporter 20/29